jgi:hypothetical protein
MSGCAGLRTNRFGSPESRTGATGTGARRAAPPVERGSGWRLRMVVGFKAREQEQPLAGAFELLF